MIKKYIFQLILLAFSSAIYAQNSGDFNSNFKYYGITEFTDGLRFMVEPDSFIINDQFKEYHSKGRGKDIDLSNYKGQIFTFRRYETRPARRSTGRPPYEVLVFENNGKEFEYATFKTLDELKNSKSDLNEHIRDLLFYEDVEIARNLLDGKQFYLIKNLGYNLRGKDKLYTITRVKPHKSDFPIQIEYTEGSGGRTYKEEFRLSGTNELHPCKNYTQNCSFSEYFVSKENYVKKQELEKDLVVAYMDFELKQNPDYVSDVVASIKNKDTLKYLDYKNDHFKFESKGKIGYVETFRASVFLKEHMKKNRDSLKLIERKKELELLEVQLLAAQAEAEDKLLNDCNYYTDEVDEFNGKKKKYTAVYNLIDKSFGISELSIELRKVDSQRYIWFYTNRDLGCASGYENSRSFVKVKLDNGDIITFYHRADTDCGDFAVLARLSTSDMARLEKSPIKTVRLNGTEFYHDVEGIYWTSFFKDKLECVR